MIRENEDALVDAAAGRRVAVPDGLVVIRASRERRDFLAVSPPATPGIWGAIKRWIGLEDVDQRRQVALCTYRVANRLLEPGGSEPEWEVAPEEDSHKVDGWVWLQRVFPNEASWLAQFTDDIDEARRRMVNGEDPL